MHERKKGRGVLGDRGGGWQESPRCVTRELRGGDGGGQEEKRGSSERDTGRGTGAHREGGGRGTAEPFKQVGTETTCTWGGQEGPELSSRHPQFGRGPAA